MLNFCTGAVEYWVFPSCQLSRILRTAVLLATVLATAGEVFIRATANGGALPGDHRPWPVAGLEGVWEPGSIFLLILVLSSPLAVVSGRRVRTTFLVLRDQITLFIAEVLLGTIVGATLR